MQLVVGQRAKRDEAALFDLMHRREGFEPQVVLSAQDSSDLCSLRIELEAVVGGLAFMGPTEDRY